MSTTEYLKGIKWIPYLVCIRWRFMFDSEIYNTKFPISVQTTFKPSTSDLYSLIINFTYTILYFNFMYMVTHKKWVFETSVFKPEKRPYRPNHWISLFYRRSSFAILSKFFTTCVGVCPGKRVSDEYKRVSNSFLHVWHKINKH